MATGTLLKATFTLLAGGAMAQLVPLLLGPLLTRLYSPEQFGLYHVFAAVAANLAVVACGRYEFALPLARNRHAADALRALCLRVLTAVVGFTTLVALAWALTIGEAWPLWLPAAVAALGLVSLATLNATALRRFRALAVARIVQYGGGAVLQTGAGAVGAGLAGLLVAPIVAAAATVLVLGLRIAGGPKVSRERLIEAAREHRDFPLLNTPHAFMGALQDTLAVTIVAALAGPAAAGFWGLTLRYLKAPATLVGGAVSQALYPHLAEPGTTGATPHARAAVIRVMLTLATLAVPFAALVWFAAPWAFETVFGAEWRAAGELASALAVYVGVHFVAAPLGIVTMAWQAQAWALKLALVGQAMFIGALVWGLIEGGLTGAGWAVSGSMALYFGWYFMSLALWPVAERKP